MAVDAQLDRLELFKAVFSAGAATAPLQDDGAGNRYALVPVNYKLERFSLERYADHPNRTRADIKFVEVASFIAYVQRFKIPATIVMCDRGDMTLNAVLDYHDPSLPAWGEHRASLTMTPRPEWQAWLEKNKHPMSQLEFAEFLEDQTPWIISPNGADLLQIALNLEQTSKIDFKSMLRLGDGSRTFSYQDDKSSNVTIPDTFELSIAPFEGTTPNTVRARLRVRTDSGNLKFFYVLINPEIVERTALEKAIDEIEEGLGIKILFGNLEGMGLAK